MRINVESIMSSSARQAVSILNNTGYRAYYVGGCVRDILLNVKPNDFDIATNAIPSQVVDVFTNHGYSVHDKGNGKKHGTVIAVIDGDNIEITTFRKEGIYSDGRHPDSVEFVETLEEDLSRRDFTINAMAIDQYGNLIDPFGGQKDMSSKILRCVGNVSDRFNQDALRVLRAIRFTSKLDFCMDKEILKFIHSNSGILEENGISVERIRDEICKILVTCGAMKGMRLIISSDLISHIVNEFGYYDSTFLLENFSTDIINRLACLLYGLNNNVAQAILRRLKFDSNTVNKVSILSYHINEVDIPFGMKNIKILINSLGIELLDDFFKIKRQMIRLAPHSTVQDIADVLTCRATVDKILKNHEPLTLNDLAVTGDDLINAGVKPGKRIGITLNYLMDRVLGNANLNTKERLMALVKEREN